ncbi:hypothetical protein P692DRAFT_201800736 [Suillus brevipes Sb2]|nr:hypothetical protein P692DRAFT_201800736 [Suillus brevipes Sb2]
MTFIQWGLLLRFTILARPQLLSKSQHAVAFALDLYGRGTFLLEDWDWDWDSNEFPTSGHVLEDEVKVAYLVKDYRHEREKEISSSGNCYRHRNRNGLKPLLIHPTLPPAIPIHLNPPTQPPSNFRRHFEMEFESNYLDVLHLLKGWNIVAERRLEQLRFLKLQGHTLCERRMERKERGVRTGTKPVRKVPAVGGGTNRMVGEPITVATNRALEGTVGLLDMEVVAECAEIEGVLMLVATGGGGHRYDGNRHERGGQLRACAIWDTVLPEQGALPTTFLTVPRRRL